MRLPPGGGYAPVDDVVEALEASSAYQAVARSTHISAIDGTTR